MALNAKKVTGTGPAAKALSAGNYMARVVQVLDLGVQAQLPYEGKAKPPVRKLRLVYELGTEFMDDDDGNPDTQRPRWVGEDFPLYNLGSERAKSTLRYNAMDPAGTYEGDFAQLGGAPCLVAIVNKVKGDKVYNNVGAVSAPIAGLPVPELVNPITIFDLDSPDMEVFNALPDWLKDIIKANLEYEGSPLQQAITGVAPPPAPPVEDVPDLDEDLPL